MPLTAGCPAVGPMVINYGRGLITLQKDVLIGSITGTHNLATYVNDDGFLRMPWSGFWTIRGCGISMGSGI